MRTKRRLKTARSLHVLVCLHDDGDIVDTPIVVLVKFAFVGGQVYLLYHFFHDGGVLVLRLRLAVGHFRQSEDIHCASCLIVLRKDVLHRVPTARDGGHVAGERSPVARIVVIAHETRAVGFAVVGSLLPLIDRVEIVVGLIREPNEYHHVRTRGGAFTGRTPPR